MSEAQDIVGNGCGAKNGIVNPQGPSAVRAETADIVVGGHSAASTGSTTITTLAARATGRSRTTGTARTASATGLTDPVGDAFTGTPGTAVTTGTTISDRPGIAG